MASLKVEICLKKKTYPEHKYSVTFVSKFETISRGYTPYTLQENRQTQRRANGGFCHIN